MTSIELKMGVKWDINLTCVMNICAHCSSVSSYFSVRSVYHFISFILAMILIVESLLLKLLLDPYLIDIYI